jgi:hypothetical protein
MGKLKYNIHHSINFKSHRFGVFVTPLAFAMVGFQSGRTRYKLEKLRSAKIPANAYSIYTGHVCKKHSQYKKGGN